MALVMPMRMLIRLSRSLSLNCSETLLSMTSAASAWALRRCLLVSSAVACMASILEEMAAISCSRRSTICLASM